DAGGDEAGLERGLEHVAREASVLADEHGAAIGHQHSTRRAGQVQREVHGHRVLADAAPHTVRAKVFSRQAKSPSVTSPKSETTSPRSAASGRPALRSPP